jgi:phenylacetate-CoA ligase
MFHYPSRMDWRFESALPGAAWPAIVAPHGAATLALLQQLELAQWLPAQLLRELQLGQLDLLLRHAAATVPYYRNRGGHVTAERLAEMPVLPRRDLQERHAELQSERVPPQHGAVAEVRTSGSTGAPVRLRKTQLSQLFWNAMTLRDHLWHRRDLKGKLAAIRHGLPDQEAPTWGSATAGLLATGPAVVLGVHADVASQLEWLQRQRPAYLLTYPSVVAELGKASLSRGQRIPGLLQVRTMGESVDPDLRQLCRDAWGAPVVDMYSAEEVGYVALQCPEHEHYHVQSESLLVEVLDEQGRTCAEGQVGRIVATDLHNFATPLLRYDIGDYAEVGPPCPCGRGLPVLTRIVGRVRNTLVTADGRRYWPTFGQRGFPDIAPVLQHQFVQTAFDVVEARLVTREPLSAQQSQQLRERIASRLPAGIRVDIVRVDAVRRSPSGKYEDFVSLVTA